MSFEGESGPLAFLQSDRKHMVRIVYGVSCIVLLKKHMVNSDSMLCLFFTHLKFEVDCIVHVDLTSSSYFLHLAYNIFKALSLMGS